MPQPASKLEWLARYSQMSYHGILKVFVGRYPSETFSRDPESYQPASIYGSGVSEGYLSAKTGQGKIKESRRLPLLSFIPRQVRLLTFETRNNHRTTRITEHIDARSRHIENAIENEEHGNRLDRQPDRGKNNGNRHQRC